MKICCLLLLALAMPASEPMLVVVTADPGAVQVINPITMEAGPRVDLPGVPVGVVIHGDAVYVSAVAPSAVYVLDISGGTMAEPAVVAVVPLTGMIVGMVYVPLRADRPL